MAIFWCAKQITGNTYLGFLISFLWSVHLSHFLPLSWVTGFTDVLMLLFLFLSLGLYVSSRNNTTWRMAYPLSIVVFALCMFSKESAIFLPVMLILYELVILSRRHLGLFLG